VNATEDDEDEDLFLIPAITTEEGTEDKFI